MANIEKSRGRIVTAEQVELRRSCLSVACAIALYAGGAGAQESSVALTSGAAAVAAGAQTIGAAQDEADDTAQLDAVGKKAKSKARKDDRDANATTLDEVRVTGIRHSVAKSLELKRESNSIVEVISAEDIGKLPDTSIAESLARVPGLAAQRTDGRAQQIAIRGLSPDFAGTLLNGREQTSAGDNRGVEFDQYPSELINGVTIYKTPDALLIGQGLSGTVDLHTISPLAVGERRVVVNARGENTSFGKLNDGSDSTGFRASASYIDQFADDTIGVAIGYAHLDSPFQEKHYKAWWWGDTGAFGAPIAGQPADTVALMGAEAWARSRDQVRDGVMAVLEFQPNDDLHSQIDLFYSHFDQKEIMRGLMWSQDPWTGNNVFVTGAQTTPFGGVDVVTGGTINNIEPIVRNDSNRRKDDIYSAGWNTTYKFTELLTGTLDLNWNRTERTQSNLETTAGLAGLSAFGFNLPVGAGFPTFDVGGADFTDPSAVLLSDPAGWGRDGRLENPVQNDEIKAARFTLRRDFMEGPFSGVDIGYNYTERDKKKTSTVFFANLLNGRTPVAVAAGDLFNPTDLDFVGIPGVLAFDPRAGLDKYYTLTQNLSSDDLRKDFTVSERIHTAYSKFDIDTSLSNSVALRGNIGVQVVFTDQSSRAFNIDSRSGTAVGDLNRGAKYTDVLPSLNLVFDFGDNWFTRFGAAKTLARPRIDDLRAAASAGVNSTTRQWSGNGGNTDLRPWRADSLDLSIEKYFSEDSYVAVAGFYKWLNSYIFNQTLPFDFTGFVNTDNSIVPVSNIGTFSGPANGTGGWLRGGEFSTALSGELFSDALSGFGVQFSTSYTDSSVAPEGPGSDENLTLPGLSKWVASGTVYFEKSGFTARFGHRYRSSFRGEITSIFAQRTFTRVLADRQSDLQLSYAFPETSSLNGLTALVQINNLTNSAFKTRQDGNFQGGGPSAPLETNTFGRQILAGFTYTF